MRALFSSDSWGGERLYGRGRGKAMEDFQQDFARDVDYAQLKFEISLSLHRNTF